MIRILRVALKGDISEFEGRMGAALGGGFVGDQKKEGTRDMCVFQSLRREVGGSWRMTWKFITLI